MDTKNLKFRCAIYMRDYGINIYSNYSKIFNILSKGFFVPFVPEYRCTREKAKSEYSIIHLKSNNFSAKMLEGGKTLRINGPIKKIVEGNTIPFMAHFMIEQQLQNDCIFTTQGAGLSKNGRAVLVMGKRGAGKTSVALELCKKYNYNLIGNDLVLVGLKSNKGYFLGGAKVFTLRFTTVKHYNTDLRKFFKKSKNEWVNKVRLFPKDLGISVEKKYPRIIRAFYVHLLNDKSAPLYIRKIKGKKDSNMGRFYLYEELSRYIRGVSIPIAYGPQFSVGDYLPSLDKEEYHKNRVKFIDWVMNDVEFYFISGSMDAICNFINQELVEK